MVKLLGKREEKMRELSLRLRIECWFELQRRREQERDDGFDLLQERN